MREAFGDQERVAQFFRQRFEPRDFVDCGFDEGEGDAFGHADVTEQHLPHVQPQAKRRRFGAAVFPRGVDLDQPPFRIAACGKRALAGPLRRRLPIKPDCTVDDFPEY